jgi:hypothetical protein
MDIRIFTGGSRKKEDPITKTFLKTILNETLTPLLKTLGLTKYNGEYLWYSDFNDEGIKFVFKYTLMKGESGLFSWGVCIEDIPTYTQTKELKNHRTDKSTTLHLWDWPKGYSKSFEGGGRPTDLISHWGEKECRQTINEVFNKYSSEIELWYRKASTTAGCLELANGQIDKGGAYNVHFPNPKYVLIFLTAKLGDKVKAFELLNDLKTKYLSHDSSWEQMFQKLEKQIDLIKKSG